MTAEPTWTVPGYVADQFVGVGALGEVWTGRSLTGGAAVTLERLGPIAPDVAERIRRHGRLPAGGHPHLMPVRDVVTAAGETVLVRDRAGGGSLATLLLHRGRLRPGEVVTVVALLASALARAHAEGLVHGAVAPERILFDAEGRPLLVGLAVDLVLGAAGADRVPPDRLDPAVAAGAAPSAATDVLMLAVSGLDALGDPAPAESRSVDAVRAALRRAIAPDPSARPGAGELAAYVRDACPPEPVRLLDPDPYPEPAPPAVPAASRPGSGRHRHPRRPSGLGRRLCAALAVAIVLVIAGALLLRSPVAEPQPAAQPVVVGAAPAATRWLRVLDDLDALRASAYEKGDIALLDRVWVAGPRLRADSDQLRALLATGCTARGVRHRFGDIVVLAVAGQRVRLRVTQWLPVSQRLRGGRVVGELTGSPLATVPLDLVATETGWRLG